MLVLSRQRDETIMIGDDIEVTVVDIRGDKVRLGINAPTRIAVHRKEVYESIRKENEDAARMSGSDVGEITPPQGAPVSPGPGRLRIRACKTTRGPELTEEPTTAASRLARGLRKTG
jgi:carbon storage regulator